MVRSVPATVPSHAAAVLPLKVWRPNWFDGVALVVGAAAPDLAYPLVGVVSLPETHTLGGLFWFCLPVTLLVSWAVRRGAPVIVVHLPAAGPWALRDYGVLGQVRHPWWLTVSSALVGAGSHVFWDGFTHDPAGHGWAVALIPALQREVAGTQWWHVTQAASSVVGAIVAVAIASYIGRHRLLHYWHGDPPAATRAPRVFWSTGAAVAALYPVTWALLPARYSAHVQGLRLLWALGLALLAGAAAVAVAVATRARHARTRRSRTCSRGLISNHGNNP